MNKKQPHRNKLPLILASLLTLALVLYGSYAYFSDQAQENAGLELTLGNVDITLEGENWKYVPGENNVNKQLSYDTGTGDSPIEGLSYEKELDYTGNRTTSLKNVRPGDKFTRVFTFKSESNLDTEVRIKNNINMNPMGPFKITVDSLRYGEYSGSPDDIKNLDLNDYSTKFPITKNKFLEGKEISFKPEVENALPLIDEEGNITIPNMAKGFEIGMEMSVEVLSDANSNTYKTKSLNDLYSEWAKQAIEVEAVQENYADSHNWFN